MRLQRANPYPDIAAARDVWNRMVQAMMMGYYGGYGGYGGYGAYGGSAGAWLLSMLVLLLLLAGVALLVAAVRRAPKSSPKRASVMVNENQHAADVLKERYATGKITFAEYERALDILGEDALTPEEAVPPSKPKRANKLFV